MPINMERNPITMISVALEAHIEHVAGNRIWVVAVRALTLISISEDILALMSEKHSQLLSTHQLTA
jgi:hypothetical protein